MVSIKQISPWILGLCLAWLPGPTRAEPSENSDSGDFAEMDLEALLATPVVEAASRRKQSLYDAPASVSLITAEEIQASGATNLAEVMRRVPGMHVLQGASNFFSVSLRGVTGLLNNRVLVLLDGRNITDRLNGYNPWGALPVGPADIDRIEVIRGPGSTLYGADALSGVINIVTKKPQEWQGLSGQAWGSLGMLSEKADGSDGALMQNAGGAQAAYAWASQDGKLGTRLSFLMERLPEWQPRSFQIGPFHYGLHATVDYRPGEDWNLTGSLSQAFTEQTVIFSTNIAPGTLSTSQQAFNLQLTKRRLFTNSLTLRSQVDGKLLRSEAQGPTGMEDQTQALASREIHAQLLLDWSLFDGRNVFTIGTEGTVYDVTEFFSEPSFFTVAGVFNNETRFLSDRSLSLHLGGRLEQIQAEEEEFGKVVYRHFSPRLAVTWRMNDNHAMRLSGSSSYRTPTPNDAFTSIHITFDPEAPPVRFSIGNPRLHPEELYAIELGYRGLLFDALRVDAVLFGQEVKGLIQPVQENITPSYKVNRDAYYQAGLELGLRWSPSANLSTFLNYTFTYSMDAESKEMLKEWPLHIYGLGVEWRLPWRSRLTADAYLIFDYEPTISTVVDWSGSNQYKLWEKRQAADTAFINLRLGRYFFEDRAEIFLMAKNLLGFFRETNGLRMFPQDFVEPIGGTVLIGITLRDGVGR